LCAQHPILGVATTQSYAKSNPKTVAAFLSAVKKATLWASPIPPRPPRSSTKAYPTSGYSDAYSLAGWKLTIPFMKNSSGQYFTQTNAQWATMARPSSASVGLFSAVSVDLLHQ